MRMWKLGRSTSFRTPRTVCCNSAVLFTTSYKTSSVTVIIIISNNNLIRMTQRQIAYRGVHRVEWLWYDKAKRQPLYVCVGGGGRGASNYAQRRDNCMYITKERVYRTKTGKPTPSISPTLSGSSSHITSVSEIQAPNSLLDP